MSRQTTNNTLRQFRVELQMYKKLFYAKFAQKYEQTNTQYALFADLIKTRNQFAFFSFVAGAYIHKRLKLNLTGSARMCFIISVFGLVGTSFLFIKCDTPNIAGVNVPYLNR